MLLSGLITSRAEVETAEFVIPHSAKLVPLRASEDTKALEALAVPAPEQVLTAPTAVGLMVAE